jgi:hypothetical protein
MQRMNAIGSHIGVQLSILIIYYNHSVNLRPDTVLFKEASFSLLSKAFPLKDTSAAKVTCEPAIYSGSGNWITLPKCPRVPVCVYI